MSCKFAQIMINSRPRAGAASDILLFEADAEKELRLGKLFALAEVGPGRGLFGRDDGLKIINFLLAEIPKNYYQNENYLLKESGLLKVDRLLESALAASNKAFAGFLKTERIAAPGKNLSLTAGVIHKDTLYFSSAGKNKAFLVARAREQGQVKNKMIDIIAESRGSSPETEPAKHLFSHIISGPLPRGACALFTSEALPEYFSEKKLAEIISALPPAGAAEQIKNDLSSISAASPIIGLIIKNLKTEKIVRESLLVSPPTEPGASLVYLEKTEKQTETFLSPSGILPFKKMRSRLAEIIAQKTGKFFPGRNKFILIGEKIVLKKRANRWSPKKMFGGFLQFAKNAAGIGGHYLSGAGISPKNAAGFLSGLPRRASSLLIKSGNRFKKMKLFSKALLAIFILCAAFFTYNIAASSRIKKQAAVTETFNRLSDNISQKESQVEASLLYGNEKGGKDTLAEIGALLADFPQTDNVQRAAYAEFKKKYDEQTEKLSHVVRIAEPKTLADFSLVAAGANPGTLIETGSKIFAADPAAKTVFRIDLSGKSATALPVPAEFGSLNTPEPDKDGNCLFFSSGKIAALNADSEKWETRNIDYSSALALGPFAVYNNRLYFINPAGGQIIRFNKSGAGYSVGSEWLNAKTDFSAAVDIAVDGDIYTLFRDGSVKKFTSGRSAELKMETLAVPIKNASAMELSPDQGSYIYILEPEQKRLDVFKKDGTYVIEYQSDKFTDLRDFSADEKNKKIYFLNGAAVFEVDAEHLK